MKLSDYVMYFLKENGVKTIFGYQGSSVSHLIDSIHKVGGMQYVQNYHEQASSFSANSYSQVSGNFGVALACSGPGATNLITGIANSYFDSIPCMFITGQVSTFEIKKNSNIRQLGFQETDIVSIVKTITKYCITVKDANLIRYYLEKALFYMLGGRPGSVVIDIPHNIQTSEIDENLLDSFFNSDEYKCINSPTKISENKVKQVIELIKESKRPVLLIGGGAVACKENQLIEKFIDTYNLPVVASLRGLDIIDHNNPNFVGFIGAYGNRHANFAIAYSDLLIVLGSRLDNRQTGGISGEFAKNAKIIRVDIDKEEIDNTINAYINFNCSCKEFIEAMVYRNTSNLFNTSWINVINNWKSRYLKFNAQSDENYVDPNHFICYLSSIMRDKTIITSDVGQNQMWVAQSIKLSNNQMLLNSGGHGAMGYSLPAAIGAYYANPEYEIVSISGDGGIQFNIQEFQTIVRDEIPIKIVIMNNQSLGLIRTYQQKALGNRTFGSVKGFSSPNYKKLAEAFDLEYVCISNENEYNQLNKYIDSRKACIIEVRISDDSQVQPEPAYKCTVENQAPLLDINEFIKIEREANYETI